MMPLYQYEDTPLSPRFGENLNNCNESVATSSYHFDFQEKRCVQVEVDGCFTTGNVFETEEDCKTYCGDRK